MTVCIRGIGTALPPIGIEQSDAATLATNFCCQTDQQVKLLQALYRRTGVERRHSVILDSDGQDGYLPTPAQTFYPVARDGNDRGPTTAARLVRYERDASPLAARAVAAALADANLSPDHVTHLVTVSCSGFSSPGFDLSLIAELPLRPDVGRTHIGFMGCHGALNGLRVAKAFVEADPAAVVVVCPTELCSLHQQYGWNPEQIVANALFADGSAAVVVTSDQSGLSRVAEILSCGSTVVPESAEMMTWRIGDHGFQMTLSSSLPDLIESKLKSWISGWLQQSGVSIEDVSSWAVHPGGPRILSATRDSLGLTEEHLEASRTILAAHGNMSSPTLVFIIQRLRETGATGLCVALGFGPGIAIEATLLLLTGEASS